MAVSDASRAVTWTVLNLWRLSVTGMVVTVESALAV